jgi:hypothetical protein
MDEQATKRWHCNIHHDRRGRGFHDRDSAIETTLIKGLFKLPLRAPEERSVVGRGPPPRSEAVTASEQFQSLYLVEPGCPGTLDEQGIATFMVDAGAMFGPVFEQVGKGLLQNAVATLIDGSGGHTGYFAAQPLKWQQAQRAEAAACPSS